MNDFLCGLASQTPALSPRYRHGVDWRKGSTAAQGPDTVLQASVEGLGSGLVHRLQPSVKLLAAALPLQPFSQGWLDRTTVTRKEAR